jgi:hypothetical protein
MVEKQEIKVFTRTLKFSAFQKLGMMKEEWRRGEADRQITFSEFPFLWRKSGPQL